MAVAANFPCEELVQRHFVVRSIMTFLTLARLLLAAFVLGSPGVPG